MCCGSLCPQDQLSAMKWGKIGQTDSLIEFRCIWQVHLRTSTNTYNHPGFGETVTLASSPGAPPGFASLSKREKREREQLVPPCIFVAGCAFTLPWEWLTPMEARAALTLNLITPRQLRTGEACGGVEWFDEHCRHEWERSAAVRRAAKVLGYTRHSYDYEPPTSDEEADENPPPIVQYAMDNYQEGFIWSHFRLWNGLLMANDRDATAVHRWRVKHVTHAAKPPTLIAPHSP